MYSGAKQRIPALIIVATLMTFTVLATINLMAWLRPIDVDQRKLDMDTAEKLVITHIDEVKDKSIIYGLQSDNIRIIVEDTNDIAGVAVGEALLINKVQKNTVFPSNYYKVNLSSKAIKIDTKEIEDFTVDMCLILDKQISKDREELRLGTAYSNDYETGYIVKYISHTGDIVYQSIAEEQYNNLKVGYTAVTILYFQNYNDTIRVVYDMIE